MNQRSQPVNLRTDLAKLIARRNKKMARSPHAFVRGNTADFYRWLSDEGTEISQGPSIWICGDCHVGNLGPIAGANGQLAIQIRDLDQTAISNPAFDILRLSLSLATSARGSDLPGVVTAQMIEAVMHGYREGLVRSDHPDPSDVDCVDVSFKQALRRRWRHLAEERIDGVEPHIPLGKAFWGLPKSTKKAVENLAASEPVKRLITSLKSREFGDAIETLDAAFWVKGCSSLGLDRYAALVGVGDADHKTDGLCLLDIKEAVRTVVPVATGTKMPSNHAKRVVEGARHLSPLLGERMAAAQLESTQVFVRELLPQDLKLNLDRLSQHEATSVALLLAKVVGRAHGRQLDRATAREWAAGLKRQNTKVLDAPSWLWRTVVDQMLRHEGAYLEHCRRYALESPHPRR
jgi:uncharacterized protein (DUF2252 family)